MPMNEVYTILGYLSPGITVGWSLAQQILVFCGILLGEGPMALP